MASYVRQGSDTLFTYPVRGSVTIETAREDVGEGRFELTSSLAVGLHRAPLQALVDSLENRASSAPAVIEPPRPSLRELEPPLTIEGDFTATPVEVEDGMLHLNWMMFGQRIEL